jgi:hypothetical protein
MLCNICYGGAASTRSVRPHTYVWIYVCVCVCVCAFSHTYTRRWRRINPQLKKGKFSEEEDLALQAAVLKCRITFECTSTSRGVVGGSGRVGTRGHALFFGGGGQEVIDWSGISDDDVDWNALLNYMPYGRRRDQCRERWKLLSKELQHQQQQQHNQQQQAIADVGAADTRHVAAGAGAHSAAPDTPYPPPPPPPPPTTTQARPVSEADWLGRLGLEIEAYAGTLCGIGGGGIGGGGIGGGGIGGGGIGGGGIGGGGIGGGGLGGGIGAGGLSPLGPPPSPSIAKGKKLKITRKAWTSEEEDRLKDLAAEYKYDWATIAKHLPHRDRKDCMQRYSLARTPPPAFPPERNTPSLPPRSLSRCPTVPLSICLSIPLSLLSVSVSMCACIFSVAFPLSLFSLFFSLCAHTHTLLITSPYTLPCKGLKGIGRMC